jgi:hypothetical protein
MTFKIWDGSSWRDPTFVRRWNGSAWVDVGQASKWNGSAWEQVWPLFGDVTVTLNSGSAFGEVINSPPSGSPSTTLVTTFLATVATAADGSGNYTYSWARISGSTAITAGSPTSATTTFSGTIGFGTTNATFRVTVTDTTTGKTATADVSVSLTYDPGF